MSLSANPFIRLTAPLLLVSLLSCSVPERESTAPEDAAPVPQQPQPADETPAEDAQIAMAKPEKVFVQCDQLAPNMRCSANRKPFVKEFPSLSEIVLPINREDWYFKVQYRLELTQRGIDRFAEKHGKLGNDPYENTSLFIYATGFNERLERALLELPEIYKDDFGDAYKEDVYLKILGEDADLRGFAAAAGLELKDFILEYERFDKPGENVY